MKYAEATEDRYFDRETGVLHNLLGIKDREHLKMAEATLAFYGQMKC